MPRVATRPAPPPTARPVIRGTPTAGGGVEQQRVAQLVSLGIVRGHWLDLGCGTGEYASELRGAHAGMVVGSDVERDRVVAAGRTFAPVPSLRFLASAAEALPLRSATFDGVLLNEVIEHVDDERATLAEARRVLRPGGHLAVFAPSRVFPFEGHGMQLGDRVVHAPVPLLPWLPQRLTGHVLRARNYWPGELRDLVASCGFTIEHLGVALPRLQVNRWLPDRVTARYLQLLPRIEQTPGVRRLLAVSTLVVARRAD